MPGTSRRICEAVLALAALAGCTTERSLDLCANPGFGSALRGGQFVITVQDDSGRGLAVATTGADAPSRVVLPDVPDGATIVVEALDQAGALDSSGVATVHGDSVCVCLSRNAWYAYSTLKDDAGTAHDGPAVGFFVRQAMPPGITPSQPLKINRARVAAGDGLRVDVTYTNTAPVRLGVGGIEVVGRPPGATHLTGLVHDFTGQAVLGMDAGQTITFQATRTFAPADPTGTWAVFSRLLDLQGVPHDGPEVHFEVGGAADPVEPDTPLELSRAWVRPGDGLHAAVNYHNTTGAPVPIGGITVTARPPGGTNAGGPFDDFAPVVPAQTVGPGVAIGVGADRTFSRSDDACADVVCAVRNGSCEF